MSGRLQVKKAWLSIRQAFFPRWDRPRAWRLSFRRPIGKAHGQCCHENKTIRIGVYHADPDDRDLLLIHEISHAVTGPSHDARWLRRMAKAADRASALGRHRLEELLRNEIENYQENSVDCRQVVYQQIEDAVRDDPGLTYSAIRRWLAGEYAMKVTEFDGVFRRARRVYLSARKEAIDRRRLRDQARRRATAPEER